MLYKAKILKGYRLDSLDGEIAKGNATDATNLKEQAAEEKGAISGLDAFFWLLIIFLGAVIFCHYVWHPNHSMF